MTKKKTKLKKASLQRTSIRANSRPPKLCLEPETPVNVAPSLRQKARQNTVVKAWQSVETSFPFFLWTSMSTQYVGCVHNRRWSWGGHRTRRIILCTVFIVAFSIWLNTGSLNAGKTHYSTKILWASWLHIVKKNSAKRDKHTRQTQHRVTTEVSLTNDKKRDTDKKIEREKDENIMMCFMES